MYLPKGWEKCLTFTTIHSNYYLTTDYRYLRQFRAQLKKIREECGITKEILTSSEFLEKYYKREIKKLSPT